MQTNGADLTDPADVLAALLRREPLFHRPEFGTQRADFERMMAADFHEIGASGQRYSREVVLDTLLTRHADPAYREPAARWRVLDARCQQLAEDLYLLTYTLAQAERISRRTTIWRNTDQGWLAVFHQGTLAEQH
ncbi:hypothetical protein SAMN02745857_04338 [Andreprevotia lacus DSM 23236]|jgi:hypothetical protein|uniref:Uncharacterized protein n=1 Tax=Andreprevotia lacus DSM 23236 TaxID=1121001 RepID=A0A1W1Y1I8_9NEIS|nr:DUF4440 domain-containing protein [Andreprevotia lacus]SMC29994.1 hypothetical protein SAMN02745857_04338 [Andreprevotia lacus DSM 23236]